MIDIRATIQRTILVLLVLTPIFTAGEVLALMGGFVTSQTTAYTPIYIKLIKDVLLVAVATGSIALALRRGRLHVAIVPFLLLLLFLVVAILAGMGGDSRLVIAGLRWILPFFLIVLLTNVVDKEFLGRVAVVLYWLFLLHIAAQVAQLFLMSPWYGTTAFGLAARVPGIFFIPSTAAFFAAVTHFAAYFHLQPSKARTAVLIMAPLSVLLTQSGTGVMLMLLLIPLFVAGPRRAHVLAPILPLAALVVLILLPTITGRGESYLALSGGTRIQIFLELVRNGEILPSRFGFATNSAVGLAENAAAALGLSARIVDSTYASIIGNLGLLGTILLMACVGMWAVFAMHQSRFYLSALLLLFGLFAATVIVTEAFPMNLLLALVAAGMLNRSSATHHTSNSRAVGTVIGTAHS